MAEGRRDWRLAIGEFRMPASIELDIPKCGRYDQSGLNPKPRAFERLLHRRVFLELARKAPSHN
jgi:hypothetical protein